MPLESLLMAVKHRNW